MLTSPPLPWLPPPAGPAPAAAQALVACLQAHGLAWLAGPPGPHRRAVLSAALGALGGHLLGVRTDGAQKPADVFLMVGHALDARPSGASAAIRRRLAALDRPLVVLEALQVAFSAETLDQLRALAPHARWLCTAPAPPDEAPDGQVVTLPAAEHAPRAPVLPAAASALWYLPAGLPAVLPLPPSLLLPGTPGRMSLLPELRAALATPPLAPAAAAHGLLPLMAALLALAMDGPLPANVTVANLLALRWMAETLRDPDEAATAAAAAARLLTAWGRPGDARELIATAGALRPSPAAAALLHWATADTWMATGDLDAAARSTEEAAASLRRVRALHLLATLQRRRGDALVALGLTQAAARSYREARALYRQLDDGPGVAATLRGVADVGVAEGEMLGAEALYDQAEAWPARPVEAANRLLGQAGLALTRGELGRARTLLQTVADEAELPLQHANALRRRADLALREGHHEAATTHAQRAQDAYAAAGAWPAVGRCLRLLGDIHAAAGRIDTAAAAYREATEVQVRVQDTQGLARTLTHAAALERAAHRPAASAELVRCRVELLGS